ncbi:hypothetical protein [Manganibacter manganicus]|uniref:Uncharacterized protein n=1 Tax=Manganibacter manganicus TaxID=1873176 RepID=A0A1V8RL71_9HYPH|nr:hypothetical protein [Pseudaminobacter manganicus]OQM73894.1 hypothetical protein BFN67_06040 [Pseudaminobacter manganicus]
MDKLDEIVISEVTAHVLQPGRLYQLLEAYLKFAGQRADRDREHISRMRQDHKEAEAGIARLLALVEKGLMDADDPAMRERLVGLWNPTCRSFFCSRMAHPTGFEPVTSAFGAI